MDILKKERLRDAGIDVDAALERLMGNESLLERLLKKFLLDDNYARLESAISGCDPETALRASHTLKGVCGNLAMTALFDLLTKQVAAFRADDWQSAAQMMPDISAAYQKIVLAVQENC